MPSGIYTRNPCKLETKEKIRRTLIGHFVSEETRRKIGNAHRGRKFSLERRKEMSNYWKVHNKAGRFKKGHIVSEEMRSKIGNSRKGIPRSEETKRKLSISHKGKKAPWRTGEKNHFWKGGITKNPNYRSFAEKHREIRKKGNGGSHTLGEWGHIKALYHWTCPACWRKEPEIKLTEDHIIPISKGGSDNIENIQPLCKSCNSKKHTKTISYG